MTDRPMLPPYVHAFAPTKIPYPFGPLDDRGVPLFDPKIFRLPGPPIYHPTPICQYGLAHYDLFVAGEAASETPFLRCAEWFIDNGVDWHGYLAWPISLPLRTPAIDRPWISGLTQGQVLSLLIRYHVHTGDERALEACKRTARGFLLTVDEGGIMSHPGSGGSFIQELAYNPVIYILNGCLYAWFGLDEYCEHVDDPAIHAVRDAVVVGLESLLPRFDYGRGSYYSIGLMWNLADDYYHGVHVLLLEAMGKRLDHTLFKQYAARWKAVEAERSKPLCRMERMFKLNTMRAMTVLRLNRFKYRTI